jgi:hypothetical protein
MQNRVNEAIQTHYTRAELGEVILAALEKAGKDVNRLTPEDLAPIDAIGYPVFPGLTNRLGQAIHAAQPRWQPSRPPRYAACSGFPRSLRP